MNLMANNVDHIVKMLDIGKSVLSSNPKLKNETGAVNAKGDKTIAMDSMIEQALIKYIQDNKLAGNKKAVNCLLGFLEK